MSNSLDNFPVSALISSDALNVLSTLSQTWYVVDVLGQVRESASSSVDYGLVVLGQIEDRGLMQLVDQVSTSGERVQREFFVPTSRNHPERTLFIRIAPLRNSLVLLLVEDLTEERRLDSVRRDFVANISHELKTPVGALSLLAEAIESAVDDPEMVQHFAHRIRREADRLSDLVIDLIDLSSLQSGTPGVSFDDVDVDDVVTEACDDVQMIAKSKKIEFVVSGTGNLHLQGRREQILTAIRNLLTNAIHYSHSDTRVAVGTRLVDGVVEISVVDQGIGITAAEQDRIFERFYRVDPARSRETGGTGLGLSIVKHVCVSHGGECTVWSQQGHGTTFTMRIPQRLDNTLHPEKERKE